jgi:hypothetical protein
MMMEGRLRKYNTDWRCSNFGNGPTEYCGNTYQTSIVPDCAQQGVDDHLESG